MIEEMISFAVFWSGSFASWECGTVGNRFGPYVWMGGYIYL